MTGRRRLNACSETYQLTYDISMGRCTLSSKAGHAGLRFDAWMICILSMTCETVHESGRDAPPQPTLKICEATHSDGSRGAMGRNVYEPAKKKSKKCRGVVDEVRILVRRHGLVAGYVR